MKLKEAGKQERKGRREKWKNLELQASFAFYFLFLLFIQTPPKKEEFKETESGLTRSTD